MSLDVQLERIALAWKAGEDPRAALEELAAAHPESGRVKLVMAYYFDSIGDFDEARRHAREAARIEPSAEAWRTVGIVCRDCDPEAALEAFKRAWELENDADSALSIANILLDRGFPPAAKSWLKNAVDAAANSAEANLAFGIHLALEQEYEPALEHLKRAADLDPELGRAWAEYGVVLNAVERHEEAIEALDRAIKCDRKDFFARVHRGCAHWALGNNREAQRDFKAALRAEPDSPEAHLYFAQFMASQARRRLAERHFEIALDASPAPHVRSAYARQLREWGEADRALELERG